jgi:hypothetical protein
MLKSIMIVLVAAALGCTTYIEHEAPKPQKIHYGGGRHYNDWHDKVYIHCAKQQDPWRCALKNGIAI